VRVLFDQGTPVPLRRFLVGMEVETAYERGWSSLENGELIAAAEYEGFDVLVTTDQNLKYQQRLGGRQIAIVVLLSTSWPRIQEAAEEVACAIETAEIGSYCEVSVGRGANPFAPN
jgi:hypothetical protein